MEHSASVIGVRVLAITAVACIVCGCSSMKGQRFDHESVAPGATLAGVPFTLNRPVPSVTRTLGVGGAADKYEIGFEYLPDPEARFTLQIDPFLLSSVDFNMAFDANGSITETTAKTTDQTGPLIVSLGKLIATAAAFDKTTADDEALILKLEKAGHAYLTTPGSTVPDQLTGKQRPVVASDRTAWSRMFKRMREEAAESPVRKNFVFLSSHEYSLLQALLTHRRSLAVAANTIDAAPANSTKADEIRLARLKLDKRALARIKAELIDSRRSLRAAYAMSPTVDRQSALDENYKLLVLAKEKLDPIDDLLADLADLPEAEWQRRLMAHLNKRIEERRYLVRVQASTDTAANPGQETADAELNALLSRKAIVLGVGTQRQRKLELAKLLERARTPRELQVLREEIATLEAAEVVAENALKSATSKAAVTDEPVQSALLHATYGTTIDGEWILTQLGNRPRPLYVVAIQPLEASNYTVGPVQKPGAGANGGASPSQPPTAPPVAPNPPNEFPVLPQGEKNEASKQGGKNV